MPWNVSLGTNLKRESFFSAEVAKRQTLTCWSNQSNEHPREGKKNLESR